jgi:hypothetical protein
VWKEEGSDRVEKEEKVQEKVIFLAGSEGER